MSDRFDTINSLAEMVLRRVGRADKTALSGNEMGDLLIATGEPRYTEAVRRGDAWSVSTATAFAPVAAVPTTTAALEIVNNHATRPFVVDAIWSWQLLGTAVVWSHTPWAQVGNAVYSANTALVLGDGRGGSMASSTSTVLKTAINQTVVANDWRVFPGSTMNFGLAAATPGGACVGQVDGALIVPPKMSLHIAVSASVATASSMHCGASGHFASMTLD